jgi:hypothetical protein
VVKFAHTMVIYTHKPKRKKRKTILTIAGDVVEA